MRSKAVIIQSRTSDGPSTATLAGARRRRPGRGGGRQRGGSGAGRGQNAKFGGGRFGFASSGPGGARFFPDADIVRVVIPPRHDSHAPLALAAAAAGKDVF